MTSDRLPFVLIIDAEPDHPWPPLHARVPWLGFETWAEYAKPLRDRLARATGEAAHLTWALRMDDQVAAIYGSPTWAADSYAGQLDALKAAGDEFGVHPHAWRWQDPPGRWLQDHADASWCAQVIDTSFNAFREAFGSPPRVHRFGSRYITPAIMRQVASLGGRVDLTVEPGARGMVALEPSVHATGYLPDLRAAPRVPYRPSQDDPLHPASDAASAVDGIWELPLTAIDPGPWLPPVRRVGRRLRYLGQALERPAELWAPADPSLFWDILGATVTALPRPFVALAVRSDSLRGALASAIEAKLDALLNHPLRERIRFATASEAIEQLTGAP